MKKRVRKVRRVSIEQVDSIIEFMTRENCNKNVAMKKLGISFCLYGSSVARHPRFIRFSLRRCEEKIKERTHEHATRSSQQAPQWALDALATRKSGGPGRPKGGGIKREKEPMIPKHSPRYKELVKAQSTK